LYDSNSPVVKLTSANFNKEVINSRDPWLVEFFAPWCGHCKNLVPEWEKAAMALKGIMKIGAVDADSDKSLGGQYGVQGFPTIKFFGENKGTPSDYKSGRTAKDIVDYALQQLKTITQNRLSGKRSSSSSSSSSKGSESGGSKDSKAYTDKDVVVLEDNNFDSVLMMSKDMWLVEFYAPWCGHCKKLEPEWNQAAAELKGKIKVAKVDATVQKNLANRFGIQGFPTIKVFPPGPKTDQSETYEGSRDASGIVAYALEKLEKHGIVPDVEQLTYHNQFTESCADKVGVCIIALLPHILDSSAQQRNQYIEMLKETTKVARGKPINFWWVQGGDNYEWEQKLNLSFGYPAVVAINYMKKKYAISKSSFELNNVKTFVNNLLIGKESLNDLPVQLPQIKTVSKWDGKDAVIPKEEEL